MTFTSLNSNFTPTVLTPTILQADQFELSQSAVYRLGKLVFGSIVLKCTADHTAGAIVDLGVTLPSYIFTLAGISSDQWSYVLTSTVRAYFNMSGTIAVNTNITAGSFVTIPICLRIS